MSVIYSVLPNSNVTSSSHVLQNQSNVFVRVLGSEAAGEYTVSFAGQRVKVFSERQLMPGSGFQAKISMQDGKIFLTPESLQNTANSDNAVQKFSSMIAGNSSERLATFLQQLGLPVDSVSLRIVQFFQSAGIKFNIGSAKKARAVGLQFPGKEDEATETALFLEQKGILADEDSVNTLPGFLYGKHDERKKSDKSPQDIDENADKSQKTSHIDEITQDTETVQKKTHSFLDELYDNPGDVLQRQSGLLTFINHRYSHSLHWIILPFDYNTDNRIISGNIRFLIDFEKKFTKKIAVFANCTGKNYTFLLHCDNKIAPEKPPTWAIEYCGTPNESIQTRQRMHDLLLSFLPDDAECTVTYSPELDSSGFFTIGEPVSLVAVDA
ncbi:MAG: hypothetical protein R3Y36_05940 [Spirochaetales bacterium]